MARARFNAFTEVIRLASSVVVTLALASTAGLAIAPSATEVQLSATALIMDGTTFPTPSQGYMDSAINDFINPLTGGSYTSVPVRTPENIIGINQSVYDGVDDLEAAMAKNQCSKEGQSCVVFGFSQSTVITMLEKAKLQQRMAAGEKVPDVTFVGIGVGNRPNGGIAERFSGIVIPFFDFTFNGASPDDPDPAHAITTIDIARQYDGLADFPQFPLNPIADLNAVLGVVFVHLLYGEEISFDPGSPNYIQNTAVVQSHGDTTYYWIPTADLPLFDPLRLVGVPEKFIDIVEPLAKVLVEAGYDRSVHFYEPTPAQLIPVIDPVTFTIELAAAVAEGANNAARILGGELPGYPALEQQLAAAQVTAAATIGVPYHDAVAAINKAVNPFQAFARIEGPLATQFDHVINAAGVPRLLNSVINPVLNPATAWAEDKILFPRPNTTPGPIDAAARQLLSRIAPNLAVTSGSPGKAAAKAGPAAPAHTASVRKIDQLRKPLEKVRSGFKQATDRATRNTISPARRTDSSAESVRSSESSNSQPHRAFRARHHHQSGD